MNLAQKKIVLLGMASKMPASAQTSIDSLLCRFRPRIRAKPAESDGVHAGIPASRRLWHILPLLRPPRGH
jgi:hypothetical protein